jgi:hypothetical protein
MRIDHRLIAHPDEQVRTKEDIRDDYQGGR